MNMRMISTLALATAAAFVGGCKTQHPVPPAAALPDSYPAQAYPTITVEHVLQPHLFVDYDNILVEEGYNTPMRVTVPLRSGATDQFLIQYQFTWYDAGGRLLREGGWRMLAMEPGMRREVSGNAVSGEAKGWRMEIRLSR